jgi:hypothetical protein
MGKPAHHTCEFCVHWLRDVSGIERHRRWGWCQHEDAPQLVKLILGRRFISATGLQTRDDATCDEFMLGRNRH